MSNKTEQSVFLTLKKVVSAGGSIAFENVDTEFNFEECYKRGYLSTNVLSKYYITSEGKSYYLGMTKLDVTERQLAYDSLIKLDDSDKEDLTRPIARGGEPIYASIIRNRSGIDSGSIDYGVRVYAIQSLCEGDKQEICDTAYALYNSICSHIGKRAKNDSPEQELPILPIPSIPPIKAES